MTFLGRARLWFLGALVTLMLSGVFRFMVVANEKGIRDECHDCRGTGRLAIPLNDAAGTIIMPPCDLCAGKGFFWTLDDRVLQALPSFAKDLSLVVLLMIVGTLVYAFKVVDCLPCGGEGCRRCGEKGWLTAADRWVAEN